jgi:uncharacterized membrane protein
MFRHHGYDGVGVVEWVVPMLLFAALIGVAVWALVVLMRRPYVPAETSVHRASDPALETARLRYARGESSREEYLRTVTDLGGPPPPPEPPPTPPPSAPTQPS